MREERHGFLKWFAERWPIGPLLKWSLEEEIAGGASYFYTLGATVLFIFVIQAVTGVLMLLYYTPSVDHAYDASMYLRRQVPLGWFIYNLHWWGNNAFVVVVSLHIVRVFIWGAYKRPRELTWIVGVVLLLLVLAMSFTGSLLVWDELGYWAAEVGTSIVGTVPIIGEWSKRVLRDGATMGPLTLNRFFAFHVAILSGLLAALIAVHVVAFRHFRSVGPWDPEKRVRIGWFWPDQVFKDLVVISGLMAVLVALSAFWRAPITGVADPIDTFYQPKPEWNFLFIYQVLKLFKGPWEPVGTVGVPLVLILILLLLPFYDRNQETNPMKRPFVLLGGAAFAVFVVVFTVLGALSHPGASAAASGSATAAPEQPAGADVEAGRKLFETEGCTACHMVNGKGGTVGPDLSDEGSAGHSAAWLKEQIRDPKSHDPNTMMPAFSSLSDKQLDDLAAYLMSLKGKDPPSGDIEAGQKLFRTEGCTSCHTVNGKGGNVGPDLSDEGNAGESAAWLAEQIRDPKSHDPNTLMPAYSELSDKQVGDLVAYLLTLKTETSKQAEQEEKASAPVPQARAAPVEATAPKEPGQAAYIVGNRELGGVIFAQFCQSCHGPRGTDHVPNPGSDEGTVPPLNPIDRELYSRDPDVFAKRIDVYLQHGSRPAGPNPTLSMPDFGDRRSLTQAEISNVEAYVLSLNGVDRAKLMDPGITPTVFTAIFSGGIVVFWIGVGGVRLVQSRRGRRRD